MDEKRDNFDREAESKFIKLLWTGDDDAWNKVYHCSVLSVLKQSTRNGIKYSQILCDRSLKAEEIFSTLFLGMIGERKLENYDYRSRVVYWMRNYVIKYILKFCEKNDIPQSENGIPDVCIYEDNKEKFEVNQKCFADLWRKDPVKAYVYFLRTYEDIPAEQVRDMLGVASVDYVNSLNSRAAALMRETAGGE